MRNVVALGILGVLLAFSGCAGVNGGTSSAAPALKTISPTKIDFATQIRPIFEARCQPCHFSGGKVYASMPFDRPETIKRLGTKLFTRIKDENEQKLIRQFLADQ